LQQPGDAGGQHPGFAGAGTGQNQCVLGRQRHGCQLLGVKLVQQTSVWRALGGHFRKHGAL